ncbi:ABC transporter permease [Desmospora profundinema]|uniref:ABC-type antimicrobial peptide transport system permease subunit n=1 Tax=Desmospora profundinema TaxID=1571184 RepID=A0ABU1IN52_9BACL|nr:ABC transporter permease [Desmospora profundinema]MDR6225982.1 ABC-type antimicrobial peptide transport system permease subunit [Desmospora profundinema]
MKNYLFSQFQHRMWRTAGVIAGIALGTALFITLTVLGRGYQESAKLPLKGVESDMVITRPAEGNGPNQNTRGIRMPFGTETITREEVGTISRTDGVAHVSPVLQLWDFGEDSYTTIAGVDPLEKEVGPLKALESGMDKGRAFTPGETGVAVADLHFAAFYQLQPGDPVQIDGETFTVIGIVEIPNTNQTTAANLYIPYEDAKRLAGMDQDDVNQVYVQMADASDAEDISKSLTDQLGPLNVISEDSLVQVMGGVGRISAQFSTIAAAVGLIGGVLLAWFSLSGLINERRREVGIMKAIGWKGNQVIRIFVSEAVLLSSIGALVGVGIGLLGALGLQQLPSPDFSVSNTTPHLQDHTGPTEEVSLPIRLDWLPFVIAFSAAMIGGAVAGWYHSKQAAKIKPAQVLRQK